MELKIGDFGLATKLEFEGDRKRTICGTPNYIAPEVLEGKHGHSYEVDVWSLGVIVYTLLVGKPPYETAEVKTTYRRIKRNVYSFPENVAISTPARDLITSILQLDPTKRPTLAEIASHAFFHTGKGIPALLPTATLACPPSASFVRQFLPHDHPLHGSSLRARLESTAPLHPTVLSPHNQPAPTTETTCNGTATVKTQPQIQAHVASPRVCGKETQADKHLMKDRTGSADTVWVLKWVDYSAKYGLGYLLSNGDLGVCFNDCSKIVLDARGQYSRLLLRCRKFEYTERRLPDKQDVTSLHTLATYPKEMQKKVTLLEHFRSYLQGDAGSKRTIDSEPIETPAHATHVHVKKWMRTDNAIMFRLSSKLLQVCFNDHTQILLNSHGRNVTYVTKAGERISQPLNAPIESTQPEMAKRLKYTKHVLTRLLSGAHVQSPRSSPVRLSAVDENPGLPLSPPRVERAVPKCEIELPTSAGN
jgi:polo-like kinase 1